MKEYLYFADKDGWRKWLEQNHATQNEAWLVHYKKHTRKTVITYKDAVGEALCFGWIESLLRNIDNEKFAQRYSPSKKDSYWSEANKKSAENMIAQGRMTEAGLEKFKHAVESGEWDAAAPRRSSDIPHDLEKALAANRKAQDNFRKFPTLRQKQLIWWITHSNSRQMRQDRINETVRLAEQNKHDSDN